MLLCGDLILAIFTLSLMVCGHVGRQAERTDM